MSNKGTSGNSAPMKVEPLTDAAELLLYVSQQIGKPLVLAMHPPTNDCGLKPGEVQGIDTIELRPTCQGVVIAVSCSAEDAQDIADLLMKWEKQRNSGSDRP